MCKNVTYLKPSLGPSSQPKVVAHIEACCEDNPHDDQQYKTVSHVLYVVVVHLVGDRPGGPLLLLDQIGYIGRRGG